MDAKIKKHNKVITAGRRLNSGNYDTCKTEQYDEIRKTFLSLFKHDFDEVKGRGNYNLDDHISHYIGIKRNWFEYAEKYFFKTTEVKKLLITISDDCITELIDHTSGYMNKKDIVECHIDYCLVCEESRGDLIYCDCCIRAYHCECIGLKKNDLPKSPWKCTMCKQKGRIMPDDFVNGKKIFKVISNAFHKLVKKCPGSDTQLKTLSKIYEMVQNLLKYDFGSYFAEPITLHSSCQVITDPKDLGTICDNMLNGVYCQNIYLKLSDKDDSAESVSRYAAFDKVILTVLKDVEKVWQNCFQRNEENTICYRMAQIMRDKCYKICQKSFSKILSPYIKNGLQKYIKECQEGNDDAHVKDNDDIDNDDDVDDIVEQQVDDNDQDINDKDNDDVVNDDKTKIIPPSIIDSSSKPIFGEGVGKGDVGKGKNEIFIITLNIRFNIDNKKYPAIKIHISNKSIIHDLNNLIIDQKPYLSSDVGEMRFVFLGKVMEVNDTPLIERGISKNNCLTVILLKKNEKNDDEMKEAIEESNEKMIAEAEQKLKKINMLAEAEQQNIDEYTKLNDAHESNKKRAQECESKNEIKKCNLNDDNEKLDDKDNDNIENDDDDDDMLEQKVDENDQDINDKDDNEKLDEKDNDNIENDDDDDNILEQQDDENDQDINDKDNDDNLNGDNDQDKDENKKRKRKTQQTYEVDVDDDDDFTDNDDDVDYDVNLDQQTTEDDNDSDYDVNKKKKDNKKTKKKRIQAQEINKHQNQIIPFQQQTKIRVSYFYIIINCNDINEYILTSFFVMLSITLKE